MRMINPISVPSMMTAPTCTPRRTRFTRARANRLPDLAPTRRTCDLREIAKRRETHPSSDSSSRGQPVVQDNERLRAAYDLRRAMLGDEYVDRATAATDPTSREFQDYITSMAWGVWARGGPLSTRDRSLIVMAMTAALGRMEEFSLHAGASGRTGVTDEEIDELLFQIAAYCGAPAAISARRALSAVRAARDEGTA